MSGYTDETRGTGSRFLVTLGGFVRSHCLVLSTVNADADMASQSVIYHVLWACSRSRSWSPPLALRERRLWYDILAFSILAVWNDCQSIWSFKSAEADNSVKLPSLFRKKLEIVPSDTNMSLRTCGSGSCFSVCFGDNIVFAILDL